MFNKCWRKRFYSNKQTWIQRRALGHTENCKIQQFSFFLLFCNNMMSFPAHHLQGHGKTTQLIKFSRQWVRLLSATATSLIYRLCHVMRDRPELTLCSTFYNPARKYTLHCCWTATCNSASRQSGIVEAHFRDADNNQHRSFQGRETLPLIEDSTVRGFRVKVQQQEEFLLLANRFSFVTFSIKLGQSLNTHIRNQDRHFELKKTV